MFGDKRLQDLAPYEVLLHDGFYGKPIVLETEPDHEFLGFMLETNLFELVYGGQTSQRCCHLSRHLLLCLTDTLGGFRSRYHMVTRGAFPS